MNDEITDQFGFKATLKQLSKDLSQLFRRVSQLETTTIPVISGGGPGAPSNSSYVTIGFDGLLSNERRIQVAGGATGVDGGANADYTITVHNAVTLDANADSVFSLVTQVVGLDQQSANSVFAGPSAGVPAVPTFRTLTTTDIPDLSGIYQPLDADLTAISTLTVNRGDIIVGNSTPTWDDLPIGGISGSLLTRDASDVLWSTFALSGTAGQTYTFPTTSGALTFGSGTSGQVAFFNGTNSIISDAALLWDNTNKMLGVGTSPTYIVDVYGANEVYNTPIFRVMKSSVTALVSSNLVALFQNTGDTVGGSDYQNEVHVGLKAGTTTRHRRYLSFRTHTDAVDWLTGANAASAYILYDGTSVCHRAFFNNTSDSNGYTYLNSAGTGIIRFNLHSDANTGTGGVEFGPGGGTTTSTAIINGSGAFAFKSAILSTYTGVVRGTITAIAGGSNGGIYIAPELSPTADSAITNYGIYTNPVTKNDFNFSMVAGLGGAVTHAYAGTIATAYGQTFAIQNIGAGTISTAYGVNASFTNSGGGTITTATAFYAPALSTSGGSTTGTFYGLRIMDSAATNLTVGVRTEITSGATKYCFYSSGTAKSWFRGDISFGSTAVFAPGAQLHVIINDAAKIGTIIKAAAAQTANLSEWQNSSGTSNAFISADFSQTLKLASALTNTIGTVQTLGHNSSGTPAAGFGSGLLWTLKSSTTADQTAAQIYTSWSTATHASRTSKIALQNVTNAGALTDRIAIDGTAITLTGSQQGSHTPTAVNLTLDATHHFVTVTAACTIMLPTAVGIAGREYLISATVDAVVVDGAGAETIDGETTQTLYADEAIQVKSDGANWRIV